MSEDRKQAKDQKQQGTDVLHLSVFSVIALTGDCLCSVWTYANDGDRCACSFLDVGNVVLELFGELAFAVHLRKVGLPAGQRLIDCLPTICAEGHLVCHDTILGVLGADLNLGKGIEHVALHHDELRHAVYHNGIA